MKEEDYYKGLDPGATYIYRKSPTLPNQFCGPYLHDGQEVKVRREQRFYSGKPVPRGYIQVECEEKTLVPGVLMFQTVRVCELTLKDDWLWEDK